MGVKVKKSIVSRGKAGDARRNEDIGNDSTVACDVLEHLIAAGYNEDG